MQLPTTGSPCSRGSSHNLGCLCPITHRLRTRVFDCPRERGNSSPAGFGQDLAQAIVGKLADPDPVGPVHRLGANQGIHDRLFRRLGRGHEEGAELRGRQVLQGGDALFHRHPGVGGGESKVEITGAGGPRVAEPVECPRG